MRLHTIRAVLGLLAVAIAPSLASAQMATPNTTPGAVVRVVHLRITPGHADAFWADVRQHQKPILDEEKRRGIISDYVVSTKTTLESPDDWNVSVQLMYPNWAALDGLGARTDSVTLAHYGSAQKRTDATNARLEHSTVVASFLVRRQTVNPWP